MEHGALRKSNLTSQLALILPVQLFIMADIALVNYYFNQCDYQQFNQQFTPKKTLIFGVKTTELQLPFDIPHFQVQPFQNQLYLTAPGFEKFLKNTDLKRQLWASLQKLFL